MAIHESAAKGFAAAADAYERGRPTYATESIERLIAELGIGPGKRVLDLAAGTGKLTRQIAPSGAEIVAVEPIDEMRARLEASLPGVNVIPGVAEDIPLPNHSVDAVVVGQAFHWFDGIRAVSEIRRVLKPTGAVGLIWQARDPNQPWIVKLEEIIDRIDDGHPRYRTEAWREAFDLTALFDPIEEAVYPYVQHGSPETIVDRVASISYVASLPAEVREPYLDEVRDLLATDPATAGKDVIELPYTSHIYWSRPRTVPAEPGLGFVASVNGNDGGVPKPPIGRSYLRKLGVDNDRQADRKHHGGPLQAVCLHSIEAQDRIRADGHQAFPGAYGDNLTLLGIDWASLASGNRLEIGAPGEGPLLQLTEDATPCTKQSQWFVDGRIGRISVAEYPQDMRWYASVVREGPVAAGDPVRLARGA
ncbi:MAG TPA: methyltransferase domain-containing protein [Candidatus Limnocylindrales bacterium]|nr:methyltransferase domain-containing protein [Candidatus Limnocylindrales bacterium]